jgi:hypothetical protein
MVSLSHLATAVKTSLIHPQIVSPVTTTPTFAESAELVEEGVDELGEARESLLLEGELKGDSGAGDKDRFEFVLDDFVLDLVTGVSGVAVFLLDLRGFTENFLSDFFFAELLVASFSL